MADVDHPEHVTLARWIDADTWGPTAFDSKWVLQSVDETSLLHDDRPVNDAYTLLRRIACESLPCVLTGDEDMLAVSALFRAGHVDAVVRVVGHPRGCFPVVGVVVSEITPSGRLLLQGSLS